MDDVVIDNNNLKYFEGKRRGSRLLFLTCEKQVYRRKVAYKNQETFECYLGPSCKAKLVIKNNNCIRKVNHNHDYNQEMLFNESKLLREIKDDVEHLSKAECNNFSSARKAFEKNVLG